MTQKVIYRYLIDVFCFFLCLEKDNLAKIDFCPSKQIQKHFQTLHK